MFGQLNFEPVVFCIEVLEANDLLFTGTKAAANCSILAHSGVWLFIAAEFSDYTDLLQAALTLVW